MTATFGCICFVSLNTLYADVASCASFSKQQCVHYVSCSKYEDIDEVVPRKLYKAWDRDNQALVALKLVEVYGFEAASAWSDHHVAVPSLLVRYACLVLHEILHHLSHVVTNSILVSNTSCYAFTQA